MNLLIVDDEIYVVRAIHKNMPWDKLGIHQIYMAFNVEKAKEIFRLNNIDILITDIEMPMESGLDLMKWVRERGYGCKAICLTCHAEFDFARKALHYGMMEYVIKPVDFKKLGEIIQRAVNEVQEEQRKKVREDRGVYLEFNKQTLESVFWKRLITGDIGKDQNIIMKQAEKMQASYDFNEEYLLTFFKIQRIYNHEKDWKEEPELMKYIVNNFAGDILLDEITAVRTGWMDRTMWIVFSGNNVNELSERIERFLNTCRELAGVGIVAYLGESSYGEQLYQVFEKLREAEQKNVTIESGIVVVGQEQETGEYLKTQFAKMRRLLHDKDWEKIREFIDESWFPGRKIGKEEFFLESEAAIYEIYRFLEENAIDVENFWTERLLEERKETDQSVGNFSEWLREATKILEFICSRKTKDTEVITRIKKYIQENIEEKISREQIAEYVHFSTDYIPKLFKKETGISLSEYVMTQKMECAKKLIEEGDDTISNIAIRMGYNSISYFSEIFRRYTGYLPSDYKRRME